MEKLIMILKASYLFLGQNLQIKILILKMPLTNHYFLITMVQIIKEDLEDVKEIKAIKELEEIVLFIGSSYSPGVEFVQEGTDVEQIQSDIFTSKLKNITLYKFDYKKQDDAKNIKFFKSDNYNAWGILADSFLDIKYMTNPVFEFEM